MTGPQMPNLGMFAEAAITLHEQYTSFVDAGFTDEQALELVQTMITAMFLAAGGGK